MSEKCLASPVLFIYSLLLLLLFTFQGLFVSSLLYPFRKGNQLNKKTVSLMNHGGGKQLCDGDDTDRRPLGIQGVLPPAFIWIQSPPRGTQRIETDCEDTQSYSKGAAKKISSPTFSPRGNSLAQAIPQVCIQLVLKHLQAGS